MTDFNLPVPDNAPWLNLSQGEVEQLTEYGGRELKNLQKVNTNFQGIID